VFYKELKVDARSTPLLQSHTPLPLTKIDPLALMRSDPLGSRDSGISFPRRSVLSSEEGDSEEAASRVRRREL
jgi:hypothetical protein